MNLYEVFIIDWTNAKNGKAVYVSAVYRLTEHDTKRVRQLISKALIM